MRRLLVLWLLLIVGCATAGRMSDDNAPHNMGGLAAVWAGQRMLVLYYAGGGATGGYVAKTFDVERNVWRTEPRDAFPNPPALVHRQRAALVAAGDVALILQTGEAGLYDGTHDRWEKIRAPRFDEQTEVAADGARVLVFQYTPVGPDLRNAAVFDVPTRRWTVLPGTMNAPPARLSPWRFARDTLVVLPGADNATGTSYAGASWKLGAADWQPMPEEGAPAGTSYEWSQAFAAALGDSLIVRVKGHWARFDPAENRWSAIAEAGAPATSDQAFATAHSLLVAGAPDAAIYDPAHDAWRPANLPVPSLLGGRFAQRATDGSLVLVDGPQRAAYRYDIDTGAQKRLDTSMLPEPRSFTLRVWTGACLLLWGRVEHHADPDSCAGATVPCDRASSVEYGTDGYVWCAK